ncbi:NAD-dependent DNA ligase [Aureococcus anophagefferens virus]|uniref:DNA ligase (NAD(+)) n=1 Tax=Aureococcus anophagefferens virus TaxID=1474867 RepID=A0A076FGB3_9VIRU|nr:NAD-dependent DNA ligase [Aureococcus anophagefferens virus]AII17120.1 NAD-dependent DNA ligase [Aureococcus anophagefferens virus]UOG94422.1 DNA ligase [Aureococcus anophagefferens virus]
MLSKKQSRSSSKKIKKKFSKKKNKNDKNFNLNRININNIHYLQKKMSILALTQKINEARDAYHNTGTAIMSDEEFDNLIEKLEKLDPNNSVLKQVGFEVKGSNKVKLPYFLPSMDKVKNETLSKWTSKYDSPYVISEKLDGVSALFIQKSDGTRNLYTRGNGDYGSDISYLIRKIESFKNIKKNVDVVIRGELIITDADFEDRFDHGNARNAMSGIVNSKHIHKNIDVVNFVSYEVIDPVMKPSQQFEYAKTLGFETAKYYKVNKKVNSDSALNILKIWKEKNEFSIDGIIIASDAIYERKNENPKHSIAFKALFDDQMGETEVIDVVWSTSKHGLRKPVVHVKAVNIGGTTVKKVSGQNAKFIVDKKIGIGAIVTVTRRGDVIPYIENVVKPAKEVVLPEGKWNETKVDIMIDELDDEAKIAEIFAFFHGFELKGFGKETIKKLYDNDFKTIPAILKMTKSDFLKIEGFKEKSSDNLSKVIVNFKKNNYESVAIHEMMSKANVFPNLGSKKLVLITQKYDINNHKFKKDEIEQIKGFSGKSAEVFINNLDKFKKFAKEIGYDIKKIKKSSTSTPTNSTGNPLLKKVVLTGGIVKEFVELIKSNGGDQGSSITNDTTLLVTKDKTSSSGKMKKAEEKGIPILDHEEFRQKFM